MSVETLATLGMRFRIRALADADALEAALAQAGGAPACIEAMAHGLAGSAGMFGEPEIGEVAGALDASFAEGRPPDAAMVRALVAVIRDRLADHS